MQFINKRKYTFALSLIMILVGVISFFVRGMNLGIDFAGGSMLQVDLRAEASLIEVQEIVVRMNLDKEFSVQQSGTEFFIRTQELTQEQNGELIALLLESYPHTQFLSADSVGAAIGRELTRNAFLSVLIASVLMLIYMSIRFELTSGIAAVVGILHNALIVVGVFSIFQLEINAYFIAAVLTVVGYSINDTLVIFDRIREQLKLNRRANLMDAMDYSINMSLSRSVNTGLTTMFPLIAMFIWGGASLQLFVMVMILGFAVGCYSSIFIASPLWYVLRTASKN
jgi:preprotein translocase subunit SecF